MDRDFDSEMMRRALALARDAAAADEVPVGAVLVDSGGAVLAEAHNRVEADRDPTAHAEMLAIRAAAARIAAIASMNRGWPKSPVHPSDADRS